MSLRSGRSGLPRHCQSWRYRESAGAPGIVRIPDKDQALARGAPCLYLVTPQHLYAGRRCWPEESLCGAQVPVIQNDLAISAETPPVPILLETIDSPSNSINRSNSAFLREPAGHRRRRQAKREQHVARPRGRIPDDKDKPVIVRNRPRVRRPRVAARGIQLLDQRSEGQYPRFRVVPALPRRDVYVIDRPSRSTSPFPPASSTRRRFTRYAEILFNPPPRDQQPSPATIRGLLCLAHYHRRSQIRRPIVT